MNRVVNPFIILMLRSPLHTLFSKDLLLLTYRGRKTGREYTLPVQYARDGSHIYIIPGMPEVKTWWHNLRQATQLRLTLQGQQKNASGRLLVHPQDAADMLRGFEIYLQRFPAAAKSYHISPAVGGGFDPAALRQAAETLIIIQVNLDEQ